MMRSQQSGPAVSLSPFPFKSFQIEKIYGSIFKAGKSRLPNLIQEEKKPCNLHHIFLAQAECIVGAWFTEKMGYTLRSIGFWTGC